MIYLLFMTCLINDGYDIRKNQYITSINILKELTYNFKNFKIVIIENNGKRKTFLDDLGYDVFYTNNNFLDTSNKGIKELHDIFDCISKYNIDESDFIIKLTGRYLFESNSNFITELNNVELYDCIIKYGPYFQPVSYKTEDCITGLIGMRCKYIKMIKIPEQNECLEWNWAKATYLIPDNRIKILDNLGILICPGSNKYFRI